MAVPRVAIVGRPNVGKSSLLNRLARRRISIVDPTPGVTRDRVSVLLELDPPASTPKGTDPRLVEVLDTGGWGVYSAEGSHVDDAGCDLRELTEDIELQVRTAMEQSDLIVLLIDAQAGVMPLDETVATLLRKSGAADRVLVVASKVDGDSWEAHGMEAAGLGLGTPICVSSTSGYGQRDLVDAIWTHIDAMPDAAAELDSELRIAIVGKRNAGKSSMVNALAGEDRVIVSEIAGTTRDAVDVRFEVDGRVFTAIDTAGVRKKKSFADDVEYYAYRRMLHAIRRADVSVLLIDATTRVSQVDKKLRQELQRQYKPTVIAVNKWDLVDDSVATDDFLEYLTQELRGLDYAPIVFTSASEGEGLRDVVSMAFNLHEQASHRETTGRVNATMEEILAKRGPSSRLGTQAKLLYATQIATNPPTLALVVNDPALFEGRYERYLLNRLREEMPYSEVPIRLVFSRRKRKSLSALKGGAAAEEA